MCKYTEKISYIAREMEQGICANRCGIFHGSSLSSVSLTRWMFGVRKENVTGNGHRFIFPSPTHRHFPTQYPGRRL